MGLRHPKEVFTLTGVNDFSEMNFNARGRLRSMGRFACVVLAFLSIISPNAPILSHAQTVSGPGNQTQTTGAANPAPEIFRLERLPVSGGAELITIHAA